MNISNTGPRELYNQVQMTKTENRANAHSGQSQSTGQVRSDKVSVSDEGVLRTEAYRTAMNAGDVRQDKVNAIKDRIANGTYEINSQRIASNMLQQESELLA